MIRRGAGSTAKFSLSCIELQYRTLPASCGVTRLILLKTGQRDVPNQGRLTAGSGDSRNAAPTPIIRWFVSAPVDHQTRTASRQATRSRP